MIGAARISGGFCFYFCCMAEDLTIITGTKQEQYEALIPQIKLLPFPPLFWRCCCIERTV